MFDRYTDRARRVLVLAQDEARNLGHAHVGSGHLLLGLIGEDGGVAAQALKALGVTLEDARRAVGGDRAFCSDPIPAVPLRFTGALTRMLEQAAREAVLLCNNYIATEHLLLGFIAGSVPGTISLVALGVNPDDARAKVLELLRGYEEAGKRKAAAKAALMADMPDASTGQRAQLIRDLDKAARDAASHVAFLSRKYRELMESDDPDMSAADAIAAGNGIEEAMRGTSEARRVLGKRARRLDGPPPSLALRAADEPGHLDIIARAPDADLVVGDAIRTGTGDNESWSLRLADRDRRRGSIGLHYPATPEELLEALNRYVDENGPWWAREAGCAGA